MQKDMIVNVVVSTTSCSLLLSGDIIVSQCELTERKLSIGAQSKRKHFEYLASINLPWQGKLLTYTKTTTGSLRKK